MARAMDRWYAWAVVATTTAIVVALAMQDPDPPGISTMLFWVALLVGVELLPVSLGFATVTMGFPIYLAVALLFEPWIAMVIAGLSAFDPREFRREITLYHALFNRTQLMLSVGVASWAFSPFRQELENFENIALAALASCLAASAYTTTNLSLVSVWIHLREKISIRQALRALIPSPALGFWISYVLLVGLGVSTAVVYATLDEYGGWAVAAFLIPLVFARVSIQGAKAQQELSERIREQQKALLDATERVFNEREEERKRIAADIHDSSLQLLAAASYGCGNAEQLIIAGRTDVAGTAVGTAREAIEDAIKGLRASLAQLRKSSVEEGGLMETITKFASQVSTLWSVEVVIEGTVEREPPIPVALAAFQIVQEGLTNALKHAQTSVITVRIREDGDMVRIAVEDEGEGFDLGRHVGEDHLGMRLMKERAAGVGGRIELESAPGSGTRLEAILPAGVGS